ncbi:MAG TPA: hypothetical protein VK890_10275, partial [Bacteroidia bacterium]|nr:hypothetical protein [Bacteroidia bacterium]
ASPWIDKNDKTIDLWKVADSIFQNNKQQKVLEWPELIIEPTFSVGHLFPTGATIKGLKINRADLPPIKL